jgi:hypothetical protein
VALARDYLTTYGPERSAFVVRHALKAAKAADFPIQTFGGTKNFLPHALAAWEKGTEADKAGREAEARADQQRRREEEERENRRRLAEMRAALPAEVLVAPKRRAEEALAHESVARTRLGYDVLVELAPPAGRRPRRGQAGSPEGPPMAPETTPGTAKPPYEDIA